jgi:uncharacterized protein (TIGR00255 family)
MTGFARVRKTIGEGEIVVSLKSVNHRGLDLHFHLPQELDSLENEVRAALKSGIVRGHVQVQVSFTPVAAATQAPVDWQLLDVYMQAFRQASATYGVTAPPDIVRVLQLPGVLAASAPQEPGEAVGKALLEAAREALEVWNAFREREGEATAQEIRQRCDNLRGLVARMEEIRAGAIPAFQKRLRERLDDLLRGASVDPQRLAQEAAILADLESIVAAGGEVGKRLDFLLQEMNRESNTILSKTGGLSDLGLTMTDLALAAKAEIDKIREQSLNLE